MANIVVEDGSIVSGANSFVSIADAKAYAKDRGVSLGSGTEIAEQLIQAMDYLATFRSLWKGTKVETTQPLQWPRKDVQIDDADWDETMIPPELVQAQCQLVIAQQQGIALYTNVAAGTLPVIKEVTGPLETTYASPTAAFDMSAASIPAVDILLAPLLASDGFGLSTLRV
jgi:hypothetical protein